MILLGYCLGTVLFIGVSSTFLKDADREWMSRTVAGVLLFAASWTIVCGVVLVLPKWALAWRTWGPGALAFAIALSGWPRPAPSSVVPHHNPGAAAGPGRARLLPAAASL